MRAFTQQSQYTDGNLALALAPALTPIGIVEEPEFFHGIATHPQVVARGLLVLADITATRYFNYTPVGLRDPVLSSQGDRLRAECFSACNSVYARLDLLEAGFDGRIGFGTTNVDVGPELRAALVDTKRQDTLRLSVGGDGLTTSRYSPISENVIRLKGKVHERPVRMPDRWIRALGNAAEIHRGFEPAVTLKKAQAQAFIASLPSATGKNQSGWLAPSPTGLKLSPRYSADAAFVSGLNRLSAVKRLLTITSGLTIYPPEADQPGPFQMEIELPCARLTISLTAEAWHGYSGEGSLLESLARPILLEDAESISSMLEFDAAIDAKAMTQKWGLDGARLQAALSLLAVTGKLGFDSHDKAYYHREFPEDPDRVLKDNPRLRAARKLIEKTTNIGESQWVVHSSDSDYRVLYSAEQSTQSAKCTCTWYLNHQNQRGPCKHILAVQLLEKRQ